jgi:hypothetical protein
MPVLAANPTTPRVRVAGIDRLYGVHRGNRVGDVEVVDHACEVEPAHGCVRQP